MNLSRWTHCPAGPAGPGLDPFDGLATVRLLQVQFHARSCILYTWSLSSWSLLHRPFRAIDEVPPLDKRTTKIQAPALHPQDAARDLGMPPPLRPTPSPLSSHARARARMRAQDAARELGAPLPPPPQPVPLV